MSDPDHPGSALPVRSRTVAAVIGFAPFILIYVLVHTRYLRPYLPVEKSGQVLVLLGLPALWCGLVFGVDAWLRRRSAARA